MTKQYRLMIYFAVATFHFYREDIIPLEEGEQLGVFLKKNKDVVARVLLEAQRLFQYELSYRQIGTAIQAYTAPGKSVADTEAATL